MKRKPIKADPLALYSWLEPDMELPLFDLEYTLENAVDFWNGKDTVVDSQDFIGTGVFVLKRCKSLEKLVSKVEAVIQRKIRDAKKNHISVKTDNDWVKQMFDSTEINPSNDTLLKPVAIIKGRKPKYDGVVLQRDRENTDYGTGYCLYKMLEDYQLSIHYSGINQPLVILDKKGSKVGILQGARNMR